MQLLRTLLFVPGLRENMIERARSLSPDAIIFDLEDSVPPDEKLRARQIVREAIPDFRRPGRQIWVRINSTYSLLAKDDIRWVVVPGLDGVLLPKADSASIVRYADGLIRDQETRAGIEAGKTRVIAAIESAAALLGAAEIGRASGRLIALTLGAEDYTADLGVERTREGPELSYARGVIGVVARALGVLALDTAFPILHDIEALVREAQLAKQAGFQGKLLIHPQQIEPVARVFTPSEAEISFARRVIEVYKQAATQGVGAVQVDGAMVDAPVVKRAERLLERVPAEPQPSAETPREP
jgi:citrate lyase subunit beta/citryl-CoA lyase